MDAWLQPANPPSGGTQQPVVQPQYIKRSAIQVGFSKLSLDDETDLDSYLEQLREAYLQQIRDGKRIQL